MITVKKAYSIVMEHNPEMKVFSCYEYSDFYMFGLVPIDWDENELFTTSLVYKVDKQTGEYSVDTILNVPAKHVREIDIASLRN